MPHKRGVGEGGCLLSHPPSTFALDSTVPQPFAPGSRFRIQINFDLCIVVVGRGQVLANNCSVRETILQLNKAATQAAVRFHGHTLQSDSEAHIHGSPQSSSLTATSTTFTTYYTMTMNFVTFNQDYSHLAVGTLYFGTYHAI